MGAPKKKKWVGPETTALNIGEKIRLFEIGKKAGQSLSVEQLPELLEETKKLILPLVQLFDKPLFSKEQIAAMECPPPKVIQNARAMWLYSGRVIVIWLERSGKWLVRFSQPDRNYSGSYRWADSRQLAEIIIQKPGDFLDQSSDMSVLLKEIPSVKKIALYNALVLRLLSQFFKNTGEVLKERKDRISVMESRLDLFGEFIQSLDPLASQGKRITMKTYSIFEHYERESGKHVSRETSDYFCPEALKPFWKELETRSKGNSKYEDFNSEWSFGSLKGFLSQMVFVFEEIQRARSRRGEGIESVVNFRTGRLPLSQEELKAIEEAVKSITAEG